MSSTPTVAANAGQTPRSITEVAVLTEDPQSAVGSYGSSVAVSADMIAVGAISGFGEQGRVYVYERTGKTWRSEATLLASDGGPDDLFGFSVAVDGNTMVVGTPADGHAGLSSGAAYVFVRGVNGWVEQAKLTASDASEFDNFGWNVAVSREMVAVGAWRDDDGGLFAGSAYLFEKRHGIWTEQAKLTGEEGQRFGSSVALSGDTLVVSAHGDDHAGIFSGAAFVYERTGRTWGLDAKLVASDAATGDEFSRGNRVSNGVAISDDIIVISASKTDDVGEDSGSAYVFGRRNAGWEEEAKLVASDTAAGDWLGSSVAVSGTDVVVGAQLADRNGESSGAAYLFSRRRGSWSFESALIASEGDAGQQFGDDVAVSSRIAVVIANGADFDFPIGKAYVFVP